MSSFCQIWTVIKRATVSFTASELRVRIRIRIRVRIRVRIWVRTWVRVRVTSCRRMCMCVCDRNRRNVDQKEETRQKEARPR